MPAHSCQAAHVPRAWPSEAAFVSRPQKYSRARRLLLLHSRLADITRYRSGLQDRRTSAHSTGDLGACHCGRHLEASAGSGSPLLRPLGRGGCCCGADTLCWELLLYSDSRGHSLLVYMVGRLHGQALHNARYASAAVTTHQAAATGSACQAQYRSMPSVMSPLTPRQALPAHASAPRYHQAEAARRCTSCRTEAKNAPGSGAASRCHRW